MGLSPAHDSVASVNVIDLVIQRCTCKYSFTWDDYLWAVL